MPLYAYKGLGPGGKNTSGVRDADSPKILRQSLKRDGIIVTDYNLSKGKAKGGGSKLNQDVKLGDLLQKVKKQDISYFTRQLSTLVKAGIPLAESLGALFDQTENVKFKGVIEEVKSAVNEGSSLADALRKHPDLFDDLYVAMVRAGETAGNLDDVLIRLADFMESSQKLKAQVQGAMVYPVIMMVVGVALMGILMVFVIPKITELFEKQGAALPLNTRMLIWFAALIRDHFILLAGALAGTVYLIRRWTRSETGKPAWHAFILKVPQLGHLVRQVAIGRFSRTLGTMLQAGVPMLRALDTAKEVLGNVILVDVVEKAKTAVTEGESLALALRRSGHFPATVTHMIAVGERSGALEQMLLRVADDYEQSVEMSLDRFTSMIEPLMLVVMGGAVGFVVFSILMPLMDMQQLSGM
jgi:general secretion pathway protein F